MKKRVSIKSNLGVTMIELIIALAIFTMFAGVISSLLYSSYRTSLQTKLAEASVNYAIQILEDIDKITYDEVKDGMENSYINKFSIPSGFEIIIDVTNYNEGNSKEDLIKKVKLTIVYEFAEKTEKIVFEKLKVKEL